MNCYTDSSGRCLPAGATCNWWKLRLSSGKCLTTESAFCGSGCSVSRCQLTLLFCIFTIHNVTVRASHWKLIIQATFWQFRKVLATSFGNNVLNRGKHRKAALHCPLASKHFCTAAHTGLAPIGYIKRGTLLLLTYTPLTHKVTTYDYFCPTKVFVFPRQKIKPLFGRSSNFSSC